MRLRREDVTCRRVKPVAHAVELLNFVQDRIRMYGLAAFLRTYEEGNFRWADLVQRT